MTKEDKKEVHVAEPMKTLKEQKDIYDTKYAHLNVHQKVLLVRRSLSYMQKDTEGFGYKYTKESTILSAIKPMMDEVGLNLDMETEKVEDVQVSVYMPKEKRYAEVSGIRMYFTFTITNVDKTADTIIKHKIVQDAGSDIKTIGGLETYGNRYFLTKYFLIPNDRLDPDKHEKALEIATSKTLNPQQLKEIIDLIAGDVTAWKMISTQFKYQKVSDISQSKFDEIASLLKMYNLKKEKEKEKGEENELL